MYLNDIAMNATLVLFAIGLCARCDLDIWDRSRRYLTATIWVFYLASAVVLTWWVLTPVRFHIGAVVIACIGCAIPSLFAWDVVIYRRLASYERDLSNEMSRLDMLRDEVYRQYNQECDYLRMVFHDRFSRDNVSHKAYRRALSRLHDELDAALERLDLAMAEIDAQLSDWASFLRERHRVKPEAVEER